MGHGVHQVRWDHQVRREHPDRKDRPDRRAHPGAPAEAVAEGLKAAGVPKAEPLEDRRECPNQDPLFLRSVGTTSRPAPVASPALPARRSLLQSAVSLLEPGTLNRNGREHTHQRHS